MSLPKISVEGVSIVVIGSFNPSIFQPAWFAAQNLIGDEEATAAETDVFHGELSRFSLDWLTVQVLRDRFMASTTLSPSFDPLRDFVVGTFTILEHTPVRMLGLNSDRHFETKSEEAWNEIGRRLAPRGPWESSLERPGLRSLTMQGVRTDGLEGMIRVKVEPSTMVKFGVYVNVNDHYELRSEEAKDVPARVAVQMIQDHWAAFLERPNVVGEAIFEATE